MRWMRCALNMGSTSIGFRYPFHFDMALWLAMRYQVHSRLSIVSRRWTTIAKKRGVGVLFRGCIDQILHVTFVYYAAAHPRVAL